MSLNAQMQITGCERARRTTITPSGNDVRNSQLLGTAAKLLVTASSTQKIALIGM